MSKLLCPFSEILLYQNGQFVKNGYVKQVVFLNDNLFSSQFSSFPVFNQGPSLERMTPFDSDVKFELYDGRMITAKIESIDLILLDSFTKETAMIVRIVDTPLAKITKERIALVVRFLEKKIDLVDYKCKSWLNTILSEITSALDELDPVVVLSHLITSFSMRLNSLSIPVKGEKECYLRSIYETILLILEGKKSVCKCCGALIDFGEKECDLCKKERLAFIRGELLW